MFLITLAKVLGNILIVSVLVALPVAMIGTSFSSETTSEKNTKITELKPS